MTEYIQAGMLELIYMIDLGIYHYNFYLWNKCLRTG